ncbi:hypothetical protein PHLCEN_2v10461 [Hermanssonia centrifuga]|uniref:Thioredoxin domain-containing protein n=1 Tax=Hermanssonia centrifuga TaxID=98765 RepID=A0A2R6NMM7_9APHY|nr:hypothetical protein PHLCEN_2v10461 [Hermanssonia centrifuga]
MPSLRLGNTAPDFVAETTQGPISFHEWIGDSWVCLLLSIKQSTIVNQREHLRQSCSLTLVTSPLYALLSWLKSREGTSISLLIFKSVVNRMNRAPDFAKRNVKVIGISANGLDDHVKWAKDIEEWGAKFAPTTVGFPIIADQDRKISTLYDMLDEQDATNRDNKGLPFTIRTVFVIDPKKTIRLSIAYPASTGRNFDEIIRVVDSLQIGDKYRVTTPVNWKKGEDVIVHPSVSNEEAKTLFPEHTVHKNVPDESAMGASISPDLPN